MSLTRCEPLQHLPSPLLRSRGSSEGTAASRLSANDGEVSTKLVPPLRRTRESQLCSWTDLGELTFLGAGEFCEVHETRLAGERVAVKFLKPEKEESTRSVRDLAHEIQLLVSMGHSNIIRVVGSGVTPSGFPFACLELLGPTLASELPKDPSTSSIFARRRAVKRWPLRRAIATAMQLADALRYCHDDAVSGYRVLHRDIKPDNIAFALDDGRLVLFDFGVASLWRIDGDGDPSTRRQLTGMTGTLRYMAPEVALNMPYNHKAEVFSFANVFYAMAAHLPPFCDLTADLYFRCVCRNHSRPKLPSSFPPALKELFADCWLADPRARPEFKEILPRLEAIAACLKR